MAVIMRTTDPKARVSLPKGFANVTVIIEQINDAELRIRKAGAIPENEIRFAEESRTPLSDRDRDHLLEMLANPPPATEALRRAAAEYLKSQRPARKRRHG